MSGRAQEDDDMKPEPQSLQKRNRASGFSDLTVVSYQKISEYMDDSPI